MSLGEVAEAMGRGEREVMEDLGGETAAEEYMVVVGQLEGREATQHTQGLPTSTSGFVLALLTKYSESMLFSCSEFELHFHIFKQSAPNL